MKTTSSELSGQRIPDALPERRYPVAPAMPEAKAVASPLPTRFKVQIGDRSGILRYRPSNTHAVDVALYTLGKSYGALAGSLYGRFLQASAFDGQRATLLQVTCSPDGTNLTGFISVNGAIQTITGVAQTDRISIPFQRELNAVELAAFAPYDNGPAIVWCTSTFDAESQRMATGFANALKELSSAPQLIIRLFEPEAGYTTRTAAWLTYHGLNARVVRVEPTPDNELPLPTIAFVDENGDITAAYTGLHGPGTGGSYRKQLKQWTIQALKLIE